MGMLTEVSQEIEIRKAVKEGYSKLADEEVDCCGGDSCSSLIQIGGEDVPEEAKTVNAGCGSPLQLVYLKSGDSAHAVVDLGSGGGIDIFRASQNIGETGRAVGIDATPEMIWRARDTARKYGDKYGNVEFRLGEIEHLP